MGHFEIVCQLKAVLPKVGHSNKHRIGRRNTAPRWVVASLPTLERPSAARESSKYARPSSLSSSSCYTDTVTTELIYSSRQIRNSYKIMTKHMLLTLRILVTGRLSPS